MHSVTGVPAGSATPPSSTGSVGHAVAELVRAFEPQDFLDRGLDHIGLLDQPLFLRGIIR